jgi:hypothetical protein
MFDLVNSHKLVFRAIKSTNEMVAGLSNINLRSDPIDEQINQAIDLLGHALIRHSWIRLHLPTG